MTGTKTRPTLAALVCVASAGGLHELSRETGGGWLAVFSAMLLALPLVSYALRPRLADLVVTRVVHGQPTVGSGTETTVRIHHRGVRHLGRFVLEDELRGHAPVRVLVGGLAPGAVTEIALTREAVARGVGPAGLLRLSGSGPFGCLQVRAQHRVPGELTVHPQVLAAPEPLTRSGGQHAGSGRPGPGTDVLGLRDWRPGEAVTAISARATARHGRPVLLEREREDPPGLFLLVTAGAGPAWERAVSQAAGLLLDQVRSGRSPVLLGLGDHRAGDGPALLDTLAAADHASPFSVGLLEQVRRRAGDGFVALVAPAPHADVLRGQDPRLVVLGA